jgi:hypothetical protein
MKDLFDKRQLSRVQAGLIANSQYDLGEKSRAKMVIALAGTRNVQSYEDLLQKRMDAFKELDELSQYMVKVFLENQDIESAICTIKYTIDNLNEAARALTSVSQ